MQQDESHDAGASGLPGSPLDHDTSSSGGFQLSAKLKEKLLKLAKWRIDQSSIEFREDGPEFRGGNATVVKAFLASPSGSMDQQGQHDSSKSQGLDPDGPEAETSSRPKPVAVKKMNILDDRARVLGLTLREAGFLVDLSHENVIVLEGFVEDSSNDIIWLVFPWEDNGTLRDFIASADWEIPERICLINDVARGVEHLHSRQPPIRHGDLKSVRSKRVIMNHRSTLVNSECRAVLTDFGSARRLSNKDPDKETRQTENKPQAALSLEATFCSSTNTMGITLTGDKYTLRWAPPEVLRDEEPGLESDIWALGWVAYEVMTNSIPFQDVAKDAIVIKRVVQGDLPSITDHARMSLIQALCSPMTIPNPIRTAETAASRARSPALLLQLGHMHKQHGDYTNALELFTNALSGYKDIGNSKGEAEALFWVAETHRFQYEYSEAVTFYSESLQLSTDIGDRAVRASALFGLADVHQHRKEYSQAIKFYSESLQIRTDLNDRSRRAVVLRGIAEVHRLQNEYSQAITLNSEALEISTDVGDQFGKAYALLNLADVHRDQGDYSEAIRPYTEAAKIFEQIGDTRNTTYASNQAAEASRLLKREYAA